MTENSDKSIDFVEQSEAERAAQPKKFKNRLLRLCVYCLCGLVFFSLLVGGSYSKITSEGTVGGINIQAAAFDFNVSIDSVESNDRVNYKNENNDKILICSFTIYYNSDVDILFDFVFRTYSNREPDVSFSLYADETEFPLTNSGYSKNIFVSTVDDIFFVEKGSSSIVCKIVMNENTADLWLETPTDVAALSITATQALSDGTTYGKFSKEIVDEQPIWQFNVGDIDIQSDVFDGYNRPDITEGTPTTVYRVQYGDTLASIAEKLRITVEALAAYNKIDPDAVLSPGTILHIPPKGEATSSDDRTGK